MTRLIKQPQVVAELNSHIACLQRDLIDFSAFPACLQIAKSCESLEFTSVKRSSKR
jgi:hypothetical protein